MLQTASWVSSICLQGDEDHVTLGRAPANTRCFDPVPLGNPISRRMMSGWHSATLTSRNAFACCAPNLVALGPRASDSSCIDLPIRNQPDDVTPVRGARYFCYSSFLDS